MLKFNPTTGFEISDISEVREEVRNYWVQAFKAQGVPILNTEPETPAGQLIDSQTASINQKDEEILFLANQFNPLTAEGIFQDAIGKFSFLSRKRATASSAVIECMGREGTVIPKGAQIRSSIDDKVWSCRTSTAITSTGKADIIFDCETAGPISAAANTLTRISTSISGWDAATNPEPAVVGCDEESQAEFEARRYSSVGLNSRSSIQSAYSRIAALNGVIAVSARQNRTNRTIMVDGVRIDPHSVYFCVLGGDNQEIAVSLYNTISAGCGYCGTEQVEITDNVTRAKDTICFSRPSSTAIRLVVTLCKLTDNPTSANDAIKDVIYQNFYGTQAAQISGMQPILRITMDTTIYSTRFSTALIAAGYNNVLSVKLAMPTNGTLKESINVPINVCPSLNKDDIEIIWKDPITTNKDVVLGFSKEDETVSGFNQGPFISPQETLPDEETDGKPNGGIEESKE